MCICTMKWTPSGDDTIEGRTLFKVGQVPSAEPVLTSGSPTELLSISLFPHSWAVTGQGACEHHAAVPVPASLVLELSSP